MNYKEKLFMRRIKSIEGLSQFSEEVTITFEDGSSIRQHHDQDCCESVLVEQVDADPSKFIGSTAIDFKIKATESEEDYGHQTYTFYTLTTSKGYLDWRWLGASNGYYSEEVTSVFNEK